MSKGAAKALLSLALACTRKKSTFTVALSGGNTPKSLFNRLASKEVRAKFPWKNIHFFWTDERWVPHSSERSNFKHFFDRVGKVSLLEKKNLHPMFTSGRGAKEDSSLYTKTLRAHFKLKKMELPRFDLIVLGVGEDGHIASLFPRRKELVEKRKLVLTVPKSSGVPETRISISLPVIIAARNVMFLLAGRKKASVAKKLLNVGGRRPDLNLPAALVRPRSGKVTWFLDKAAASELDD